MSTPPRILAFAGSARRESLNRKYLAAAVEAVRDAGAAVTVLDLNEHEMPLYHGDLEDSRGLPAAAVQLIKVIQDHDGLLIASPEYNGMVTPLLKNTLDWCTRGDDNPFQGKTAAVVSASPGALGGARSLLIAQQLLNRVGCLVIPGQNVLPHADKAFDAEGRLLDARVKKSLAGLATNLVETTKRLRVPSS